RRSGRHRDASPDRSSLRSAEGGVTMRTYLHLATEHLGAAEERRKWARGNAETQQRRAREERQRAAEAAPALEKAIARNGEPRSNRHHPWPALRPLPDATLPPVPAMRSSMLPRGLRAWLVDAAERLDVPLELVGTPALVMLGGLIGRRLCLRPKRYDDWIVVPNLWGAIITRPGFLKSPAMHEAKRHLSDLAVQPPAPPPPLQP